MRVKRKKGVKNFRIVGHNKKVLYWIFFLLILLGFVVYGILKTPESTNGIIGECNVDSDCVPSSCCHPGSCVPLNQSPSCGREGGAVFCTMNCEPNTLDCGQGNCVCIEHKCSVNWSP